MTNLVFDRNCRNHYFVVEKAVMMTMSSTNCQSINHSKMAQITMQNGKIGIIFNVAQRIYTAWLTG